MYCYRRYGHNEGDDLPSRSRTFMRASMSTRRSHSCTSANCSSPAILSDDDAASLETEFELRLEMTLEEVKALEKEKTKAQDRFHESTPFFNLNTPHRRRRPRSSPRFSQKS